MIRRLASERGFTLIEALVALAIGGFVIATLANVTGQWMRSWRFGLPTLQRSEMLVTSLDRIVADLSAARFVPANANGTGLIFSGEETAVTLVRQALPVENPGGFEVIRLAPQSGHADVTLARSRTPLPFGSFLAAPIDPAPVVLLRPPYAVRFAYADEDRTWRTSWHNDGHIPRLIRVAIVDRGNGRPLLPPIVVRIHIDAPALCATIATSARTCDIAMARDPGPMVFGLPGITAAQSIAGGGL